MSHCGRDRQAPKVQAEPSAPETGRNAMPSPRLLAVVVATAAVTLAPASALARHGGGGITKRGTCSRGSTSELKLRRENRRIETEFEVDQNRSGVRWHVTLRRNGSLAASTSATTRAPGGSFTVRRLLRNRAGADTVVARAKSPSGETCIARATIS
jgi:hypothetical protein